MKKADREIVFNKYGGKCAYCGCELQKGWHADHVNPVYRFKKAIGGNYVTKDTGTEPTTADIEIGNYEMMPRKLIAGGMHRAHNDNLENMMPSCPSCNIYKHSADLETFRFILTNTIKGLIKNSAQYKFALRYGLVIETDKPVVFYFETYQPIQP